MVRRWTFDSDRRLVTEESGEGVHLTPKIANRAVNVFLQPTQQR